MPLFFTFYSSTNCTDIEIYCTNLNLDLKTMQISKLYVTRNDPNCTSVKITPTPPVDSNTTILPVQTLSFTQTGFNRCPLTCNPLYMYPPVTLCIYL